MALDFTRIQIAAAEAGLTPDIYWDLTPAEIVLHLKGVAARDKA